MRSLSWILVVLSAVAFIMAVAGSLLGGGLLHVTPEGYSRASNNLALLAIALFVAAPRK
jgi:hypothetical protein